MVILIFLILSSVLSVILIHFIPFGLEIRQKKLISVAVPVIGSLGIAFSFIATPWQSMLVIILLAASAGYGIITRATGIPRIEERTPRVMDSVDLSKSEVDNHLQETGDQAENIDLNEIPVSNTLNSKEIHIAEDISFLEVRNNTKFELTDIEVIPVLNFEGPKDEEIIAYDSKTS
ncbi:hypothetical protein [Mesobacillus jeotgali]|uniref:hypothetical protein n=1 Tax=Mesobacillus jeotgali TaxID=129985 RepID=UPI00177D2D00|nr:hypothetical protein [Mesobacillus jeotgali]UYZ20937.1 hypothetical protein FOF60_18080 [Mesobacillus jeotgali]